MSDAEMHGFLKAAFGVENCNLKANTLFNAATSSTSSVWASVRAELQLESQPSLELHIALSEAFKKAAKAGKNKPAPKNKGLIAPTGTDTLAGSGSLVKIFRAMSTQKNGQGTTGVTRVWS